MALKYSAVERVQTKDGLVYRVMIDLLDTDLASNQPAVGSVASWTPTTAYIMSVNIKPSAQHFKMELTAKDVDIVSREINIRGKQFSKTFYVLSANLSSTIPAFGDTTSWTPETAYAIDSKVERLGDNYLVTITAVDTGYRLM